MGTMRALLVTIGSYGDVLPFVALGRALAARGHETTVVSSDYFRRLVEEAGLRFLPLGEPGIYERVRDHPDLWHPMRGFKTVFTQAVAPVLGEMVGLIEREYLPGESIVVGSSLALGVRLAEEKHGFTSASVHLQPSLFRSVIDPPKLGGLFMPRWMPRAVKRGIWWLGDRLVIDPIVGPALNPIRAEMGLPPITHALDAWWHCPRLAIGLFPAWYAPPPADWPPQVRLVGFPLYDQRGEADVSANLEAFLAAGDAPIAFTPGSAMAHGDRFFHAAVEACQRLRRRGILLTLHHRQIPATLPPDVIHLDYAPFSRLLPRCAAVVHHGGIGTTSQALRAGVPQLIMPFSHDQPDNAQRVRAMGVGESIAMSRFTGRRVAAVLERLMSSPTVAARCAAVAERFAGMDGIGTACDLLEQLQAAPRTAESGIVPAQV